MAKCNALTLKWSFLTISGTFGTFPARAGTAPTSAGTIPADVGTSPASAGTAPRCAGTGPASAGLIAACAGTAPTSAGNVPASAGRSATDGKTRPPDAPRMLLPAPPPKCFTPRHEPRAVWVKTRLGGYTRHDTAKHPHVRWAERRAFRRRTLFRASLLVGRSYQRCRMFTCEHRSRGFSSGLPD
jgi:hypothetical protein